MNSISWHTKIAYLKKRMKSIVCILLICNLVSFALAVPGTATFYQQYTRKFLSAWPYILINI